MIEITETCIANFLQQAKTSFVHFDKDENVLTPIGSNCQSLYDVKHITYSNSTQIEPNEMITGTGVNTFYTTFDILTISYLIHKQKVNKDAKLIIISHLDFPSVLPPSPILPTSYPVGLQRLQRIQKYMIDRSGYVLQNKEAYNELIIEYGNLFINPSNQNPKGNIIKTRQLTPDDFILINAGILYPKEDTFSERELTYLAGHLDANDLTSTYYWATQLNEAQLLTELDDASKSTNNRIVFSLSTPAEKCPKFISTHNELTLTVDELKQFFVIEPIQDPILCTEDLGFGSPGGTQSKDIGYAINE